jgi:hypothetical protein
LEAESYRIPADTALPSVAGPEFEAFLRRLAEEIIDQAVLGLIDEADRIVFEEDSSNVIDDAV